MLPAAVRFARGFFASGIRPRSEWRVGGAIPGRGPFAALWVTKETTVIPSLSVDRIRSVPAGPSIGNLRAKRMATCCHISTRRTPSTMLPAAVRFARGFFASGIRPCSEWRVGGAVPRTLSPGSGWHRGCRR